MIRIGIIGTENTHALAFSRSINLPNSQTGELSYPNVRVVGVYGPDMESAQKILDETHVDFIADKPEDFFGKVDAMMVTSRKGSLHYKYSMPFIQKGIPMFIDKPFTSELAQAKELVAVAKEKGVSLAGGSGCKLAQDIVILKNRVKVLAEADNLITGSINFPADLESEYDGLFFYASHLIEMALTVFGFDPKSVAAFEKNSSINAILRYDSYDITLHFTKGASEYTAVIYSKNRNYVREIDITQIYGLEVEQFVHMLKTGRMPHSYEHLIMPVAVIEAILESLKSGKETSIFI